MSIRYIFFDLDGTLLPMDQDTFVGCYFKLLSKKMLPYGYDPKTLIDGVLAGTEAMTRNDGKLSNEEVFWRRFAQFAGGQVLFDKPHFEEFYQVEFQRASSACGFHPEARNTVALCWEQGFRAVLAVNPIFPRRAMETRLHWAGLAPEDFELISSYEDFHYCKPNPAYYRELLDKLGVRGEECLMVGNDVTEDTPAEEAGMKVFLLTDCLINKEKKDLSQWHHGGWAELQNYIRALT